jgi:hypothetical protein
MGLKETPQSIRQQFVEATRPSFSHVRTRPGSQLRRQVCLNQSRFHKPNLARRISNGNGILAEQFSIIAEVVEPLNFSFSAFQIFSFYPSSRLEPNYLRGNLRTEAEASEEWKPDSDGWFKISEAGEDEAKGEIGRGARNVEELLNPLGPRALARNQKARSFQPLPFPKSSYFNHNENTGNRHRDRSRWQHEAAIPLPAWLKPGRAHVLMSVESVDEKPKRRKLTASPEMLAQRAAAL